MAIRTVAELIDALGGTRAICEARGVGKTAVSNWRVWGWLPERHHFWASQRAIELGVEVAPDLFASRKSLGAAASKNDQAA